MADSVREREREREREAGGCCFTREERNHQLTQREKEARMLLTMQQLMEGGKKEI